MNSSIFMYLILAYLLIINVATFIVYGIDGTVRKAWNENVKLWIMILLPIVGGSIGACLGNYFFNTAFRRTKAGQSKILIFESPLIFLLESIVCIYFLGGIYALKIPFQICYARAGILGYYFLIVNIIAFLLIILKRAEYFFWPINREEISNKPIIIFILIGGATGALISKLLFNFKYRAPCDVRRRFAVFMYGIATYLLSALQLMAFIYLF